MATRLREVRRPKGSQPRRALTAASQLITDPQKQMKSTLMGASRTDWQVEAWEHSEKCGELGYYISWRSNSCARTALIASDIDPDTGRPTGGLETDEDGNVSAEAARVMEYVRAIADGPLGQAALIARVVECLTVVGEVYVAVLVRQEVDKATGVTRAKERWYAVTREEIKTKTGEGAEIELPDKTKHEYNSAVDSLVRVWKQRPRRASEPTSPVRAVLETLREIARTSAKIRHAARSRLMNAGILLLPEEMSLPAAQAPIPEGLAQLPGMEMPTVTGVPAADQLATQLYQASVASMEDENNQTAYIPQLVTAKGEHIKDVKHITFSPDVTDVEIKTRTDAIARLAMGLDVSPERLLGMSTGNHWSAWQIEDSDVQLHIKPVMDLFCQAVYAEILSVFLRREGIDPAKYTLTIDATGLTADPDLTEEALKAHAVGAVTSAHLRRLLNVGEDSGYDMETLEGCQEFARDMVAKKPELLITYLPLLTAKNPELEAIEFPEPVAIGAGDEEDPDDEDDESGAANQEEPDTEASSQTASLSPIQARAEYILAERLLVHRALHMAGNRRVKVNDSAMKARLRGRTPNEYHRVLGPVRDEEIPRLVNGWDVGLEDEVVASLGINTQELRNAVLRAVRRELTTVTIDGEVV